MSSILLLASNNEDPLVKSLHAIDTISSRISTGDGRRVELLRAADGNVAGGQAAVDPTAAAAQAIINPLEYPPLSVSTVPGDRVAIVVHADVPQAPEIVRGVVDALHSRGIDDDGISIVTTSSEFGRQCKAALDSTAAAAIHSVTHDPDDELNLCIVGQPKRREPVRVNRTIFDADVVLPIGCARLDSCGAFDSLFPSFSSAEVINRFRTLAGHDTAAAHANMVRETNEAGWLIGVSMVVQVVPGADDAVAQVVAGEPQAVARKAAELSRQQWAFRSPRRVNLVIATLGGGPASQTWANVGRALVAAERLVEEDSAIAICTNLDVPPGESLGHLIGCSDLAAAKRKIAHEHAVDSWTAWQLARALQRGPVYFLSQLDADTVEDLGMAPVADVDELVRLASRRESCVLLNDAQHALASVDGEDDEF